MTPHVERDEQRCASRVGAPRLLPFAEWHLVGVDLPWCTVEGSRPVSVGEAEADRWQGAVGGVTAIRTPNQGFMTTFRQSSSLLRKVSNPRGASFRGIRWVMTKLGSMSPLWIRSNSGRR
jgi:hypothetical protein